LKTISPQDLKPLLTQAEEIAFLDVRESGQHGEGHPFFSTPLPYSRLEARAEVLLPCKLTPVYLLDDADGVAERAAQALAALGHKDVAIVAGGAEGWAAAGYTLFKGVHVPSKTYGELLEHAADTPSVTADELQQLLESDHPVVVLDGRSPDEYRKMSLPGALCCPNAELGYRLQSIVPDETTTVVVNCAGRTRSIVGAEGLRVLNTKNPVYALENGTQGWRLAGFDLHHGVAAQDFPDPDAEQLERLSKQAATLIEKFQLRLLAPETLAEWQLDRTRTTYLFDVRTAAEFNASHWPGARHAPGGQLVQTTDTYVAVRNARVVLSDDNHLRAATTAIRLQEMGHDVWLLDADAQAGENDAAANSDEHAPFPREASQTYATILDASPSMRYRESHIDGAIWVTRARLDQLTLDTDKPLLVTGRDPVLVRGVVNDLTAIGFKDISAHAGSPDDWAHAGFELVSTPDSPPDKDCIDYLFFVHDRHDGNLDAARRYLAWETGLIAQLDNQERSVLNPGAH